jgi:transposase
VGITLNTGIKSGSRKGRRNYPVDFKKQLAIAACMPGVSVARLALDNGINANMLHKWRRVHLAEAPDMREAPPSTFVEVHMTPAVRALAPMPVPESNRNDVIVPATTLVPLPASQPGVIEISLATATLRLEGAVDAAVLARVLRHFRT